MSDDARKLLERLVAWAAGSGEAINVIERDTRAFLAREQDGPVAEGWAQFFYSEVDGVREWYVEVVEARYRDNLDESNGPTFACRIPVPREVYDPTVIVGSVVENQEGKFDAP